MREMRSDISVKFAGTLPPLIGYELHDGIRCPLAQAAAVDVNTAHAGVSGEGKEVGFVLRHLAPPKAVGLFGKHHNRAAFGRFIGQAGELRRVRQFRSG